MTTTSHRRRIVGIAAFAAPVAAIGMVALPSASQAHEIQARATVRAADGTALGTVRFTVYRDKTEVSTRLRVPRSAGGRDAFHGFHIHANDNPANGNGCIADPARPAATWFASADGHLSDLGQSHGAHKGDLPSLLVNADGTAEIRFTTQRLSMSDLEGRAVVVHVGPDNFGNVPVGTAPDQYTANSSAAVTKTSNTGNAGDRLACGLISIDRG